MNNNYSKNTSSKNRRKKKSSAFGKFVGGLFFFVLDYLLLAIIFIFLLFLNISCRHRDTKATGTDVSVVVGENVDEKSGDITPITQDLDSRPVKDVIKSEGSAYVPSSVFELLGASVTPAGDPIRSITLNLNDVEEYASFEVDSDKVNVNGTEVTLNAKTVMRDGELYIPIDFFQNQLRNVSVELEKGVYTVRRLNDTEPVSFLNKPADATPNIKEGEYFHDSPIKFRADLSKYESYMNPENRDDYLYVVNVNNLLPEDFVPEDLRDVQYTKPDREKQQMCLNAQMAADAMMIEAREYGFDDLWVTSAYRSYQTQVWLFNNEIEAMRPEYGDRAEEKAKESVNPPGASEHQTGLTADIHSLSAASMKFADTDEAKWLEENAQYFGFVLRYPEDKVDVTGIMYEPWHFRYVGRYHAMRMKSLGMCLEEYNQYLNK